MVFIISFLINILTISFTCLTALTRTNWYHCDSRYTYVNYLKKSTFTTSLIIIMLVLLLLDIFMRLGSFNVPLAC